MATVDPREFFSRFENRCSITKDGIFKTIKPFDDTEIEPVTEADLNAEPDEAALTSPEREEAEPAAEAELPQEGETIPLSGSGLELGEAPHQKDPMPSNWKTENTARRLKEVIDLVYKASISVPTDFEELQEILSTLEIRYSDLDDPLYLRIVEYLREITWDRTVLLQEADEFIRFSKRISDPVRTDAAPIDRIAGRLFLLSGEFYFPGGRDAVKARIEALGGVVEGELSDRTDYVVAGTLGSPDYEYGSYGHAIKDVLVAHLDGRVKPQIATEFILLRVLKDEEDIASVT